MEQAGSLLFAALFVDVGPCSHAAHTCGDACWSEVQSALKQQTPGPAGHAAALTAMFNALDVRLAASQQQQAVAAAAGKTAGGKQAHKKKGRKAAAEPQPAQVRCRPYMLGLCLHECAVLCNASPVQQRKQSCPYLHTASPHTGFQCARDLVLGYGCGTHCRPEQQADDGGKCGLLPRRRLPGELIVFWQLA